LGLQLNPKALISSIAKGFAPDFLSGVLEECTSRTTAISSQPEAVGPELAGP